MNQTGQSIHSLWKTVLGEIEISVPQSTFAAWFAPTKLIEQSGSSAVVAVQNAFARTQFEKKYDSLIRDTLRKNNCNVESVTYVIEGTKNRASESERHSDVGRSTGRAASFNATMPIVQAPARDFGTGSLNPKYTFDSFIVGSSNDLAFAACQNVAAHPGDKYNPLFLYGGVGLGKTHLIQAVGNEIVRNNPNARVLYVSTETFVREFLDSIRLKRKGSDFSDHYRNVDVLIIDDMQFIANKTATQEEFFHTFNDLHQSNKQIIITSDKPPKSIPTLTDRLRSRFEWGMAIDIQMPDFETRSAIIETKAAQSGVTLERETVEFLANNIKTNIRELEGALNHLLAHAEMRGVLPNIEMAEGLLGDVRASRPHHVTPKQIVEKTAKHFSIPSTDILGAKRDKHIVVPRQVAMYLLRSELHLSFPKIAVELGRKDHTTAIHSVEKIEKAMKLDFVMREQVNSIREKLYG
jgi:chromosomal replication initiator protein